jgi:hypothetical protein
MDKVEAPAMVGQHRNVSWRSRTNCAFAPLAPQYGQALLPVQTLGPLAVDRLPLALQQGVQPAPLVHQITQLLLERTVVITRDWYWMTVRSGAITLHARRSLTSCRA